MTSPSQTQTTPPAQPEPDLPNPVTPEPDEEASPDLSSKGFWQQLPTESTAAHAAFTAFIALGPGATLPQVAERIGRSVEAVRKLSSRHYWIERASSWRQHNSTIALQELHQEEVKSVKLAAQRRRILQQQEWERSQQLAMVSSTLLNQLLNNPSTELAPYVVAPLLRMASKAAERAMASLEADAVPDSNGSYLPWTEADKRQFEADVTKVMKNAKESDWYGPPSPPAPIPGAEAPVPTQTAPSANPPAHGTRLGHDCKPLGA